MGFMRPVAAAPDIVAQNYAAAAAPGIQSCTKGYGLLSGDVEYGTTLIQGALPYTMRYRAPLRQNLSAAQNFEAPEESTSGWTDNYQSHVITQAINIRTEKNINSRLSGTGFYDLITWNPQTIGSFVANVIRVRLPGESSDTLFKEQNGVFSRLYSADAIRDYNSVATPEYLPWNTNLGEYSLSRSGTTLIVIKSGVKYTVASPTYVLAPPATFKAINLYLYYSAVRTFLTATNYRDPTIIGSPLSNFAPLVVTTATSSLSLQRVTGITTASGLTLTLAYDNKVNLTRVSDNQNNVLNLEHNYRSSILSLTQTLDETRLVTKVTLTSGTQGDSQVATLGYASYATREPSTGSLRSVFSLVSSNSSVAGSYTYNNQLIQNGATPLYVRNSQIRFDATITPDATYNYPTLTQVTNSLGQVEQQWNITQNYIPQFNPPTATSPFYYSYSAARTTLQSLRPGVSGLASAMDMTTTYDDVAKTITMSYKPDGVQTATTTISSMINSPTNITLTVAGAPCLSVNGKPITSATFNTTQNQMLNYTDARGYQSAYKYDALSRVLTATEAVGTPQARITSYTYTTLSTGAVNTTSVPNTIVSPVLTVTNILNARGQITNQTKSYPSSAASTPQTWLFYYHEDALLPNYGLLNYTTGPTFTSGVNDMQSWVYDIYGNVASHNRYVNNSSNTPVLRQTTYTNYNSAGQPSVVNYPDGTTDTMTYNASYRTLSKVSSGSTQSMTTSNTYDTLNRVISATDGDGKVTTYAYDAMGRPSVMTDPSGNTTNASYFPNNSASAVTQKNPSGEVVASTWNTLDAAGRLLTTRQGSANRLSNTMTYDANGNVTKTVSSLGISNTWTYDPLNRVISHTDGNGKVDTKAYDAADNNMTETAANTTGSSRGFIQRDVLKQESNTDFGLKSYTYDKGNRLIARSHGDRSCGFGVVDQDGRTPVTNCWTPDPFNKPYSWIVQDAYTYDSSAYGNLDEVEAISFSRAGWAAVSTSYTYDAFHRVLSKTQTPGFTASQQKNNYSYTVGGKLATMTFPSGNTVTYGYSATGLINNIKLGGTTLVSNINFDGANRLRGWTWGSASGAFNLAIDDGGLMTGISNTTSTGVSNFNASYLYDVDGRLTKNTVNISNVYNYTYDNNSQLLTESLPNASKVTYTYDSNGNRLTLATTGTTGLPYTSASYGYSGVGSPIGNLLKTWTKNGVAQYVSSSAQGELEGKYVYDPAGRRNTGIWFGPIFNYNHKNERTSRSGANLDRQYAYDESSHLIGEYTGSGALIVEYVWLGDRPVAAVYPNNRIVYLVTDHQNKPRRGIDAATQAVVWSWDPDAFGVLQPAAGLPNGVEINLRFPGQYYDVHSGLYYNHNRYYNPELGRYMEPDPIGLAGGLNPYAYVGNDPVNKVDPSGLFALLSDSQLSGVVGSPAPGSSSSGGGYIPSGVGGGGGVTVNGQGGNYYWQGSSSSTTTSGTTVTTSTGYSPNLCFYKL